jgi:hypothetical protein
MRADKHWYRVTYTRFDKNGVDRSKNLDMIKNWLDKNVQPKPNLYSILGNEKWICLQVVGRWIFYFESQALQIQFMLTFDCYD